ncbi:MAG: transposase [Maioricimonas sp. JB049]
MNSRTSRRAYPSDVSDPQWAEIVQLLATDPPGGRHRTIDLREVVNALSYRWQTGCVWRMLPHDFPPWTTVYWYVRRWRRDDTLRRIRDVLLRRHRVRTCSNAAAGTPAPPAHRGPDRRASARHPAAHRTGRERDGGRGRERPDVRAGRPAASRADSGSRCSD